MQVLFDHLSLALKYDALEIQMPAADQKVGDIIKGKEQLWNFKI